MDQANILRQYGLFDAKVPRYTSYPPANQFRSGVGMRVQHGWLEEVPADQPVSIYVHIPFCRRLCWFCACRTQGTKTLAPVEDYVNVLINEIDAVAKTHLQKGTQMRRLHLGGGTPTLLNTELMGRLLDRIFECFVQTDDFEFSVEIDPTEAPLDVLDLLSDRKMARASVGVQDFDPKVQKTIGRIQSFDVTHEVISALRDRGVNSLNIDFLYGLPHQSAQSLVETLDRVVSLRPDRLALYGYAHVPHVSKRQVMIPDDALPGAEQRYQMAQIAKERLVAVGYKALGFDHFALPHDSLTKAAEAGTMSRNFQGYTDDPCDTLIGFGASSISKFPQGYTQNAVSTSAYMQRVRSGVCVADRGLVLTPEDKFVAALIDALMCNGEIDMSAIAREFPDRQEDIQHVTNDLLSSFPDLLSSTENKVFLHQDFMAVARLLAAHIDRSRTETQIHSLAV